MNTYFLPILLHFASTSTINAQPYSGYDRCTVICGEGGIRSASAAYEGQGLVRIDCACTDSSKNDVTHSLCSRLDVDVCDDYEADSYEPSEDADTALPDPPSQVASNVQPPLSATSTPVPKAFNGSTSAGVVAAGVIVGILMLGIIAFFAVKYRPTGSAGPAPEPPASISPTCPDSDPSSKAEEGRYVDATNGLKNGSFVTFNTLYDLSPANSESLDGTRDAFADSLATDPSADTGPAAAVASPTRSIPDTDTTPESPGTTLSTGNTVSSKDLPPVAIAALSTDPLLKYITNKTSPASVTAPSRISSDGSMYSGVSAVSFKTSSSALPEARPWQFEFSQLQLIEPLGSGTFGNVYLANYLDTPVAVKSLVTKENGQQAHTLPDSTLRKLHDEAALMARLRHPNCVAFMGMCDDPPCIAVEYCPRGSLFQVLKEAVANSDKAAELTWLRRLNIALDCAKGMLYLHAHQPPVLHRDLKSANLLVTDDWQVKVADFNLSKVMEEAAPSKASTAGAANPRWLAPEVLEGKTSTLESDVFSFGVVMWELLTWKLPWDSGNVFGIIRQVQQGQRLPVPPARDLPGMPPGSVPGLEAYIELMNECWAQKPWRRPKFQVLIPKLRDIISIAEE